MSGIDADKTQTKDGAYPSILLDGKEVWKGELMKHGQNDSTSTSRSRQEAKEICLCADKKL